jgi:hypothetical protein
MGQYQGVGFGESVSIPEDLFILNPSYQRIVTGKRNYRYMLKQYGLVGLFLSIFFAVIILVSLPGLLTEVRLATLKTAQAKGEIIDHRISRSKKSTSYYVTYQFMANDQTYEREESVSSSEYYSYEVGGSAPVTYVKDDPNTSHIGENGIRWSTMMPALVMGGFVLIFIIIVLFSKLPHYLRIRRMKRDGQLILGHLKSSSGMLVTRGSGKSRRTDYDVTIHYEFTTPTGKTINTNSTCPRNDLKKKELQTQGTIAVLYVNDSDFLVM